MEKELACTKCGSIDGHKEEDIIDKLGRKHIKATCRACGAFIKFLDQGKPKIMYFGKYKGKEFKDIPRDYLKWCVENKVSNWKILNKYLEETK